MGDFADYTRFGWKLCGLPRGSKSPNYPNWNTQPMPLEAADGWEGAGLLHALSGTAAIDIDDLSLARPWLAEQGVDLDGLLSAKNAVRIDSGRAGRAKLLYRMKTPLRTIKPEGSGLELRCATLEGKSVHDALPPSVHPNGVRYRWVFGEPLLGDWAALPSIPATLLSVWRGLVAGPPPVPKRAQSNGHAAPNGHVAPNGHDLAPESGGYTFAQLSDWLIQQDPNGPYDSWFRVGAKLHDATGGSEDGLQLWDDWSAQATRQNPPGKSVYQGLDNLRAHWLSFSSTPGKVVASLDNELPATADEFEVISPEAAQPQGAAPKTTPEQRAEAKQSKNDAIAKLEARLVYVRSSERYFDTERHALIGSDQALEHQFTSMMPRAQGGPRWNPVKVLKQSVTKRYVEGLGFHPGEGAIFEYGPDEFANTYRNRLPTPIEPTPLEVKKIEWIFARINDVVYRRWIMQFYAHIVQRPAIKIKTAPLIWSETQQSGKSTIVKKIPELLVGRDYSKDVGFDLLSSPFNDYLQNAWHLNLVEFRAGTRGDRTMINNKLKNFITDDTVALSPKGRAGYTMPNHFFVTASSNEEDAAAIDDNDERWGVHELKAPRYTESENVWIHTEFLSLPRAAAVLRHYF